MGTHRQMGSGVILLCGIIAFYILFWREDSTSTVKSWKDVHVTDVFLPAKTDTWLRHLIETATGFATGSVYKSRTLTNKGFIGEREPSMSGKVLTVKTHLMTDRHFVGAILLVRNPYRATVAEYNRRKAAKTENAPDNKFKTREWRKFVKYMAERWMRLNTKYISRCNHQGKTCKSILIVYYERLQEQPANELRRILEYLSISIDEERFACAITNSEGVFHRQKKNWTIDPFSREDRILMDRSVKTFCDLLQDEGLEDPPSSITSYPDFL